MKHYTNMNGTESGCMHFMVTVTVTATQKTTWRLQRKRGIVVAPRDMYILVRCQGYLLEIHVI